ncbi:MAG: hypothetical protein M1825_002805 [Sarcosagium campestre]|nr:MAG: hypothetical protein M1825_002805 [Sarcosagium campestre]
MPPTPLRPCTARLHALNEAHKLTLNLISRLYRLPSQLGSNSASGDPESDARIELGSEIHQRLKDEDEALELLRQEVEDLSVVGGRTSNAADDSDSERARLEVGVRRLGEDLKNARSQFRRAQLAAKRAADTSRRKERELLLSGAASGSSSASGRRRGQEKLSHDDLVVAASTDITAALRRTHQMMQTELSRSQFAHDTLQQSTQALASLSESYSSLSSLLTSSRTLLGTLLRSQKSDTWYLESALYILTATVCWLVFRRLLYGPLWWFVYLPIRLVWRTLSGAFSLASWGSTAATTSVALSSSISAVAAATATGTATQLESATGDFPTWGNAGQRVSVAVGMGGGGARNRDGGPHTVTEEVVQMADQSERERDQERGDAGSEPAAAAGLKERGDVEKPNPKKRMWEEPPNAGDAEGSPKEGRGDGDRRKRDEL